MYPSAATTDSEATYINNVQRAHELRKKAQQLAKDELAVLNQAVDLNLLARQLAEATMRPNVLQHPTSMPFYISLPAGMSNPAFRMQLMHAQQAAIGQTAQYMNLPGSNQADALKTAAAAPAAAGSGQNLPHVFPAEGVAAAPVSSGDPAAAAAGNEAQQSPAPQSIVQAASEAPQQPYAELPPQQQCMAPAAAPALMVQQLQAQQSDVASLHNMVQVQQAGLAVPAGPERIPQAGDQVEDTTMDVDS